MKNAIIFLFVCVSSICVTTPACKKRESKESTVEEQSSRQESPKSERDSSCSPPFRLNEKLKEQLFILDKPRVTPLCVEVIGPARRLWLKLSIPENGFGLVNPPIIHRIAIYDGKHWNRSPVCAIAIVDHSKTMTMNEWVYGNVPPGYQRYGCGLLSAGEYVVSVVSGPTDGVARFRVKENDSIESIPLDDPVVLIEPSLEAKEE